MKLRALESSIVDYSDFSRWAVLKAPGGAFFEELNTLTALGILRIIELPGMTEYLFNKDLVVEFSDGRIYVLKKVLEIIK